MPLPCQKWHCVHMDWMEGLPASGPARFDSLLVVVDAATRMCHLIPTHKTSTAEITSRQFFTNVVRLHGLPRILRTDRDPRFMSGFWKSLCKLFDIQHAPTVAFNPQGNGKWRGSMQLYHNS